MYKLSDLSHGDQWSVVLHMAGKRRVWHSGSISTYLSHVWLYPENGIGIFADIAGPYRYDTSYVFFDLLNAISDLVVFGIRPSALAYSRTTPGPYIEPGGHAPPRPLSDYVGTYVGQWSLMNATVTLDRDAGVLRLAVGRMLTADLRRYDCLDNEFDAVIGSRLWWVARGVPQQGVFPVRFRASSSKDGRGWPDVLVLPQEIDDHSRWFRFTRDGLRLPDDWTPRHEEDNTCSAARFTGPQAWILLTVLLKELLSTQTFS